MTGTNDRFHGLKGPGAGGLPAQRQRAGSCLRVVRETTPGPVSSIKPMWPKCFEDQAVLPI